MDGFMEGAPISLVTYTLDQDNPSHTSWMADTKLLLEDLWADKTFISNDVPWITPLFPILRATPVGALNQSSYFRFGCSLLLLLA